LATDLLRLSNSNTWDECLDVPVKSGSTVEVSASVFLYSTEGSGVGDGVGSGEARALELVWKLLYETA
jgi:hypothetical protein